MILVFSVITLLIIGALLFLFHRKMALQMQYLQIQSGKKPSAHKDFLFFDWKDAKERELRKEAFLLFPMLYAVSFEEPEKKELEDIKYKVKRSHIGIYFCIILFITLGVLSERILPA